MRPVYSNWKEAYDDTFEQERDVLLTPTKRQREYIINMNDQAYLTPEQIADGYHACVFPFQPVGKDYVADFHVCDNVHIHHVYPKGYAECILGWDSERINSPENLVPVCEYHHITNKHNRYQSMDYENEFVEVLHPDMPLAFKNYRGDTKHFMTPVNFERNKHLERGEPYHNTWYDQMLQYRAEWMYRMFLQGQLEKYGKYVNPFPYLKRKAKHAK